MPSPQHVSEDAQFGQGFGQAESLHGKPHLTIAGLISKPKTPRLTRKAEWEHGNNSLLTVPRHRPCTPPRLDGNGYSSCGGRSSRCPGSFNAPDMEGMLRSYQDNMMKELQDLLSRHEKSLEFTLSEFQDSLFAQVGKLARQNSPARINPLVSPPSSPPIRASERRPSVNSVASDDYGGFTSENSTKYVSMQDMRAAAHLSRTHSGLSRTRRSASLTSDGEAWVTRKARVVVNSLLFELLFATLILVNSVLLGVEVGVVSASPQEEVPHFFYYSTIFFSFAFLSELSIRLLSEGGFVQFLFYSELRAWNWFDFFVVMCSLVEVGFNFVLLGGGSQSVTRIMRMARMTRLGRVLRVARIVRFVSQLRVLVISIMSTLQTLLWALFLLLIIIYVFGVLLAQATAEYFSEDPSYDKEHLLSKGDHLEHYWGSLQAAMYTLFMSIAGGVSWEAAVFAISGVHWIWGAFFTCFIAFSSFALINVMTAVFCQSAIETAQRNMDVKWQSMCADKQRHIKMLKRLFKSIDGNLKGTISVKKLQKCWEDDAMQAFLHSMELEPDDCWTFFTILDRQEKEVNAADFVEGCLRLKGFAKAFDVAVMTYELRHLSKQNVIFMNQMQACMHSILNGLSGMPDDASIGSNDVEEQERYQHHPDKNNFSQDVAEHHNHQSHAGLKERDLDAYDETYWG